MKIKTAELIGPALDWAVAKCEGRLNTWTRDPKYPGLSIKDIDFDETGCLKVYAGNRSYTNYRPSTDWAQGGLIIDREGISLDQRQGEPTRAYIGTPIQERFSQFGPTALIAAMRCYVASRLGDEIDIPEELL
jgi:uncharacterized protein DUF2591